MNRGYALLSTLLLASLCLTLLLGLHVRLVRQWTQVNGTESQLHAMVAAQNGIEIARSFLPSADPKALLEGKDGTFQGSSNPEWRNPISFNKAMVIDPEKWTPMHDDGIPFPPGEESFEGVFRSHDGSFSLFRFSNNPEESPEQDDDRIFIVRSMGIVPAKLQSPPLTSIRNNVALVEARLRKEEAFLPLGAMTLLGEQGHFNWSSQLTVEGGDLPGIAIVPLRSLQLFANVSDSLSQAGISSRIRGNGSTPSISVFEASGESIGQTSHLLVPDFWLKFLSKLPEYVDPLDLSHINGPRLAYLPEGGSLDSPFQGLLIAQGDLALNKGSLVEGLLIHVGNGSLTLQESALIRGGLWLCGVQASNSDLTASTIQVEVNGAATVVFDPEWAMRALSCLPATRLQWRILFPEMLP